MSWETDFVEPDRVGVRDVAAGVLAAAADRCRLDEVVWVRSGSSTLVGLTPTTAIRISRTAGHVPDLLRAQRLVDALPALPFAVPRSRTEAITRHGVTGLGAVRVVGEPRPPGPADPATLRALLDAIHGIDPAPLDRWLAPARSFCGGADWQHVLADLAVPALPATVRDPALALIDDLAGLPDVPLRLNHGDLAGSNILWDADRIVGVLDWDLTSRDDPAEDVASLAGWHGWHLAPALADPATVGRAGVFRRVFPLMILGFTLLNGRPSSEVARAVARVVDRLGADDS